MNSFMARPKLSVTTFVQRNTCFLFRRLDVDVEQSGFSAVGTRLDLLRCCSCYAAGGVKGNFSIGIVAIQQRYHCITQYR